MRRLVLFLFLASIASAKEYRLLPPHVPMPKIVEAVPPPQTHVFAALDVNNAFTGNNTHSGTETFTGPLTAQALGNIKLANASTAGADCGARINTQDAALGANPGEIWVDQTCGLTWTTTVSLSASHTLRIIQGGTYVVSAAIAVGQSAGIVCGTPAATAIGSTQIPCIIKAANSTNLASVIILNGFGAFVQDVIEDGNQANNPTAGVGIKVNLANRVLLDRVTTQNNRTHGVWFSSTLSGNESCCASVRNLMTINNKMHGLYGLNTADLEIGSASQFENNGTSYTVNTTGTTVTATAGTWSTDSSNVGTLIWVSTASGFCAFNVTAVGSTTTLTVGNGWSLTGAVCTLGTQTGVVANWGSGIGANNAPTMRLSQYDFGGNLASGFEGWCTVGGGAKGSGGQMLYGGQFGNNTQADFAMFGADFVTPANGNCSQNNEVYGQYNGTAHSPDGTWSMVHLQDGGQNRISGVFISNSAPNRAKNAVEFVETAAGRAAMSHASVIKNTLFSGLTFSDTTSNGNWLQEGNKIFTNIGSGSMQLFDASNGSTPSKWFRVAGGNLQILNNAFSAAILYLSDAGTMTLPVVGSQLQLTGATSGTASLQSVAIGGGTHSFPNNTGTVTESNLAQSWTAIQNFPSNTAVLTADWTCGTGGTVSSCVAATIIGSGGGVPLTFTLPLVAQSYTLECDGVVGQATAVTANQWNLLTATNGATNVTANYTMATAATASAFGAVTDQASTTTTFQIAPSWTLGAITTKMPFHIWAKIEGASASGTVVSLQLVAPTVADLVTIYRGASCRVF